MLRVGAHHVDGRCEDVEGGVGGSGAAGANLGPTGGLREMSFGAASRAACCAGSRVAFRFAACARECRGGIGANPSTALSRKPATERSGVEGYPGPSARLAKRRLLFLSQRSPTGEGSFGSRLGSVRTMAARKRFIHWLSMHKARLTGRAVSLKTNRPDTAPRRAVRLPFESPLPCPFLSGGGTTLRAAAQPPFFFAGWAGRLPPMVETLRAHGFTLLLLLNTLVVGLLVGGALCATFICR
jgi:hypothetical protein